MTGREWTSWLLSSDHASCHGFEARTPHPKYGCGKLPMGWDSGFGCTVVIFLEAPIWSFRRARRLSSSTDAIGIGTRGAGMRTRRNRTRLSGARNSRPTSRATGERRGNLKHWDGAYWWSGNARRATRMPCASAWLNS